MHFDVAFTHSIFHLFDIFFSLLLISADCLSGIFMLLIVQLVHAAYFPADFCAAFFHAAFFTMLIYAAFFMLLFSMQLFACCLFIPLAIAAYSSDYLFMIDAFAIELPSICRQFAIPILH